MPPIERARRTGHQTDETHDEEVGSMNAPNGRTRRSRPALAALPLLIAAAVLLGITGPAVATGSRCATSMRPFSDPGWTPAPPGMRPFSDESWTPPPACQAGTLVQAAATAQPPVPQAIATTGSTIGYRVAIGVLSTLLLISVAMLAALRRRPAGFGRPAPTPAA
jgi:hypothetical protein